MASEKLPAILPNSSAPGSSQVSFKPFSFALFNSITVNASAGDDQLLIERTITELEHVLGLLDADQLLEGRNRVKQLLASLRDRK